MGDAMKLAQYFLSGLLTMGYAVAALYFLRFWRESRDRLFAFFATGFLLLAAQRALLAFVQPVEVFYVIRLVAFLLIVAAILQKNRAPSDLR
jgi:hypothetical protein